MTWNRGEVIHHEPSTKLVERAMKTNWLAAAWAHCMFMIATEIGWIIFALLFLVPKFQKLTDDGVVDPALADDPALAWMFPYLDRLHEIGWKYGVWLALAVLALAVLFEWRVKSERKMVLRLAAWGTLAACLTVVSVLMAASLALPQLLSGPVASRMAITFSKVQVDRLGMSIVELEQAMTTKDWDAMEEPAKRAAQALYNLDRAGPALRTVWSPKLLTLEELRALVREAGAELRQAISANDAAQMEPALKKLRRAYGPLREGANFAH